MSEVDDFLNSYDPAKPAAARSQVDELMASAPSQDKGFLGHAKDVGLSALKGTISVPEAGVGIADIFTGGRVGKALENEGGAIGFRPREAREFLNQFHTEGYQDQQQKFQQADGILGKAAVALRNPSLITNTVVESLPLMGAGGVVARGLMGRTRLGAKGVEGGVAASALGEGTVMAGSQAEGIRQETDSGLITPVQSAAAVGTGALGALFAFAGGRLAQKLGIGDVDTMLARGVTPRQVAADLASSSPKSIPRQVIEGAISEGFLEELPQEVSEQILQNLALGDPWHKDVEQAAVMGTLAGMAMGGAGAGYAGMVNRSPRTDTFRETPTDPGEAAPPAEPTPSGPAPGVGTPPPQVDPQYRTERFPSDSPRADTPLQIGMDPDAGTSPAPSLLLGLDPNAGPLSSAAAIAVDSGATQNLAEQEMLAQAAEAAQGQEKRSTREKPDKSAQPELRPGERMDPATGEIVDDPEARADLLEQRISYYQQQARLTGWTKDLLEARNSAQSELDALRPEPAQPAPGATAQGTRTPKQQKAIDRIARGKAYFFSQPKAQNFIDDNGLASTHELEQRGKSWHVVEKKAEDAPAQESEARPESTVNAVAAQSDQIDAAAHEAATSPQNDLPEPTQAQKLAGNYSKGHVRVQGLDITIENPQGSERSGVDPDGNEWRHTMSHHYGYIKRTSGADGDQVDVYVGPNPTSDKVFVVDQIDQQSGRFDEHKVMAGFDSEEAAVDAYRSNFDDGWKVGPVRAMGMDEFKAWLDEGDTTKPAADAKPTNLQEGIEQARENKATQADDKFAESHGFKRINAPGAEWVQSIEVTPNHVNRYNLRRTGGGTLGPVKFRLVSSATFPGTSVTGAPSAEIGVFDSAQEAIDAFNEHRALLNERRDGTAPAPTAAADIDAQRHALEKMPEPKWWTDRSPTGRYFVQQASGIPNPSATRPWNRFTAEQQRDLDQQWGERSASAAQAPTETAAVGRLGRSDEWRAEMNRIADRLDEIGKGIQATSVRRMERGEGANADFDADALLASAQETLARLDTKRAQQPAKSEPEKAQEAAPKQEAAPEAETKAKDADRFAGNKLFTADKVAAARARMKSKLGRLNSGIDPEMLVDGMTIAGAYIESGVRNFTQYARAMIEDLGDGVKPYLLSFWEGARNYPGLDAKDMTDPAESARQHDALLTHADTQSEAVGTVAEKPKKRTRKTGSRGDMVMTQDWGVEHIDGYGDAEREAGNDTKDAFLRETRTYLNAVADALRAHGYEPHPDRKGRPGKPVSVNESGVAGSGDVTLTMHNPENGNNAYIHIGDSALRGVVPVTPSGIAVMYRVGPGTDRYAAKAGNTWAPVDLSANELAALVSSTAQPAQETRNEQPADEDADQGGAQALRRRGRPAQPGDPSADSGRVASGQPQDDEAVDRSGDSGRHGLRQSGTDVAGGGGVQTGRPTADGRARAGRARSSDAGAGGAGTERAADSARSGGRDDADAKVTSTAATGAQAQDLHIENPLEVIGGTPVQRFNRNRQALELLQRLEEEGRQATPDEQKILAGYTGWGSFGQELFQGSWERPVYKDEGVWKERGEWLRETLGESAWKSAQRSITNAHFTDPPTVMAMWDMVRRLGFTGGKVLEPSMGTGNFVSMMPADLKARSQVTGIELDETTGAIAKQLFPQSNIRIMGYEKSRTPDDFYDLVIGNWPFENTPIADRRYNRLNPMLHDYFFLKTLDQVRPGGIVIGITSAGSMDKQNTMIRREMARKAELLASIRLPSGAFQEYAGTKVVTDIVILRKRPERLAMVPQDAAWVETGEFATPSGEAIRVNQHYLDRPQHVIGQLDYGHGTTTFRAGMIVHRPDNMAERLKQAVELVPADAMLAARQTDHLTYYANETGERHGAVAVVDDRLMVAFGDQLVLANDKLKYELKDAKKTAAREKQIRDAVALRRLHTALVDAERAGQDAKAARRALKAGYEAFVAQHGALRDSYALSYMERLDDPFYYELAALENDDGTPATVMTRSTTRGKLSIKSPGIREAYVLARNESVTPSIEQIAQLSGKTQDEVRAELLGSGAVFEGPAGDVIPSDIYLSGNVRLKLREAQAALADGNAAMQANVDALQKVVPADIPYFNVETKLGATWVPNDTYAEYIAHMLGRSATDGVHVTFRAGRWKVKLDGGLNRVPEALANYGTADYPFSRLVQAALSNQVLRLYSKNDDGSTSYDAAKSERVNSHIAKIREDFAAWLWGDPERRVALEREYNESRNAWATPRYDGSFLAFEGMALSLGEGQFNLRRHQADAIWRAIVNRRSINAHEVGTGKTFTMGGIAVESRRYGIARKPLILAHNANSATVAKEIRMMYPLARVLYVDNLDPKNREVRLRQIANDDWDAIVIPHSLIDRLALREEMLMEMAADDIKALEAEFLDAAEEDNVDVSKVDLDDDDSIAKIRSTTAKELAKARKRIIESIKKQAQKSSREGAVSFEDLGVDMILVDEVHEFKKPPIVTRMKMKGLNTQVSNRSIALQFLTRYVRQMNNGGNVHTFTGTPITNTITEIYHQMKYVMESEMDHSSVSDWDGWFGSFATEIQDVELSAAGDYEMVTRLAGFVNVPELRRMVGQYMDTVFAEDMPEMRPRRTRSGKQLTDELTEAERAELLNGRTEGAEDRPYKRVINVSSDMTPAQQSEFQALQQYAQQWRNATGRQKRAWMRAGAPQSPIITEGLASKASFDVRLLDNTLAGQEGSTQDDPGSKASRVVANVLEIYNSHSQAGQVIFADMGFSTSVRRTETVAGGEKVSSTVKAFSTVNDIVERLVQGGIPRAEIAVVRGSTDKQRRREIAESMNDGRIRVVIGSTDTLGVGVNMQRNLRAMHHLDAPYMPGELEQRNGRGHRQGNQWNTVLEYRYMTDRLDGRRWQILAVKQRFINAFMKANSSTRVIEGEAAADEQSDILESFSEAAGDPRILQRVKLQKKLESLQRKEQLYTRGIAEMRSRARLAAQTARRIADDLQKIRDNKTLEGVTSLIKAQQDGFAAEIDGQRFDARKDAAEALSAYVTENVRIGDGPKKIGTYRDHDLMVTWRAHHDKPTTIIKAFGEEFDGTGIAGAEARLRNYRSRVERMQEQLATEQATADNMEKGMNQPFGQATDLERIAKQLSDLEADLSANPVPPPAWLRQGAPIDAEVYRAGKPYVVTGHRYGKDGWFVVAEDAKGATLIPYLEATDAAGMPLYEEHEFVAPTVVTKADDSQTVQSRETGAGEMRFSRGPTTKAAYEARVDALFGGEKATTGTRVLDRSDVMRLLGYPDAPLLLNESHLLDGMASHPEMTPAQWKRVPWWIENPAVAYEDKGRIVMIAPDTVAGYPVRIVIEPEARRAGRLDETDQLLVTVFAKTTAPHLPNFGRLAADGAIRYVDTKKAPEVWQSGGAQFPKHATSLQRRRKILTEKNLAGWRRANTLTYSFAGIRAEGADQMSLATAQAQVAQGVDPEAVRRLTGWHRGVDGKWRFEISDHQASLKVAGATFGELFADAYANAYVAGRETPTAGDILEHDRLFAAYPALAEIPVAEMPAGQRAQARLQRRAGGLRILVQPGMHRDAVVSAMLHELQHGIQLTEGFASGGSRHVLSAAMGEAGAKAYRRLAGEVEARNTQARQDMPPRSREVVPPEETADVAAADVIVTINGKRVEAPPQNAAPAAMTQGALRRAMSRQFPSLNRAFGRMLERGQSGERGGLVLVHDADPRAIARVFAQKTGRALSDAVQTFSNAGTINGFYDPRSGLTFMIMPNVDEVTAPAVILHEMVHGQQRKRLDKQAHDMIQNRARQKDGDLRAFLDRVAARMEDAGETGNQLEAAPYIVEQAVMEGRSQGHTLADSKFLAWVDKAIGKPVGDFLRGFLRTVRGWMLRNGIPVGQITVDDLVQYAMVGMERAAQGDVAGASGFSSGEQIARRGSEQDAIAAGFTMKAYRGVSESAPFNNSGSTWSTTNREVALEYAEEIMGYDDPAVIEVLIRPDGLKRYDASRLTDAQRAALDADGFGNPQAIGIYDRSDDHTLGGGAGNVTVIHAPNSAIWLVDDGSLRFSRRAQTNTPEFKRWFGDSKVVDSKGRPRVMYHGTAESFDAFRRGRNSGFYFAADPVYASMYAGENGSTMPVYLSIKNPLVITGEKFTPSGLKGAVYKALRRVSPRFREYADLMKAFTEDRTSSGFLTGEQIKTLEGYGYDGIVNPSFGETVVFHPEQIKSATGNRGTFDPASPDIRFSRSGIQSLTAAATAEINRTFTAPGRLNWWHKTVGTMYNLAERSPHFKPVFESAQNFIDDVAYFATDAAELAPNLLPRLETWRDIAKRPITSKDNGAIAKPIFEGTLLWTRDENGAPVRLADGDEITSAGIVWTDAELRSMFGLNDKQVGLYREFREATNRSLDTMARADMIRYGGDDLKLIKARVMDASDVHEAARVIVEHLRELASVEPDRATSLMQVAHGIIERAARVKELQDQGYAPLSRFGQYTVDVVVDGARQYFGMFESKREANKMREAMAAEFGAANVTQGTLSNETYKLFAGVTPETLELFGTMLGLEGSGDQARDHAFQEYLRLTKTNRSAMRRLIHRKGVAGYSEDVGRVLASFVYSNSRQTAAGLNIGELGEAINAIPKEQGELKDAAVRLGEYIKNPQEEGQVIRGFLFAQYLGGSVASAFVNLTQPAQVTFPWLTQFTTATDSAAQIAKAVKHMSTRGFRYEADLAAALKAAEDDGTVSPQEIHQLMGQARGSGSLRAGDGTRAGDARVAASNATARLSLAWGKMFSAAEQANRRITFIAAYRIARDKGMTDPAGFARRAVRETQFVYSKASKMQWGRGAVGGTLMTFKTYSISYIELMHRLWTQGEPGSQERAEGRKAAMIMIATLMLLSGVGGLPFIEDVDDVIDGAAQLMGYNFSIKKVKEGFLEDVFGDVLAEFIDRGFSGFPGFPMDASGRLGLGNLIPGTGLLQERTSHTRDVLEILGPGGDFANRVISGGRKVLGGNVGGGLLEMSPVAVRNLAKGTDMAVHGMYRDTKGYKVLDTNLLEAAVKAAGIQPASVSKIQGANWISQRAKNYYNTRAQEIRQMWAAGIFENDMGKVQRARDAVARWDAKNPDQPMLIRIPDVMRRVREMAKTKDERIAATAPRAMRQQMREDLSRARANL